MKLRNFVEENMDINTNFMRTFYVSHNFIHDTIRKAVGSFTSFPNEVAYNSLFRLSLEINFMSLQLHAEVSK